MKERREAGQVTVLALGLVIVVMAVIGVAVDGTKAFLFRRTLQSAADGAAVAAASELDETAYYSSGGSRVRIEPEAARLQAFDLLRARGIQTSAVVNADARSVRVILRGRVSTSFLNLVGISAIPVAVQAEAEPFAGS